jgi:predicted RNA binding protein YcfA (HicA-like mRNA interferase family)
MPTTVEDIVRCLKDDGWTLVASRGSHRQFTHKIKKGRVTVPGKVSADCLERMREDGLPIPQPSRAAEYVEVADQVCNLPRRSRGRNVRRHINLAATKSSHRPAGLAARHAQVPLLR